MMKRQKDLLNPHYKDFIFKTMGLNYDNFVKIHHKFNNNLPIKCDNLYIPSENINFKNEPLFKDFKIYILNQFGITYTPNKLITFILRRGTREITNIDFVKQQLGNYNINYVYLEDISIQEQLSMSANSSIIIGVHGAGLTWSMFMEDNSKLIELYPGKSNTDNYIRFCKLSNVKYKRISINDNRIHKEFRLTTVNINTTQINNIINAMS